MSSVEHDYEIVYNGRRGFFALCRCGWQSETYSAAGLAGSAFDIHRDAEVFGDERD